MKYSIDLLGAQAKANLNKLRQPLGDLAPERTAYEIAASSRSQIIKFQSLQRLTQSMSDVISNVTACRNGCSHCCCQAVDICELEAKAISKAIGQRYVKPKITDVTDRQKKYRGVPCNFLEEGRCSIYEARPIICRTYANLSNISEVCNCTASPSHAVPLLNNNGIVFSVLAICGADYYDIRDWFPNVLHASKDFGACVSLP